MHYEGDDQGEGDGQGQDGPCEEDGQNQKGCGPPLVGGRGVMLQELG